MFPPGLSIAGGKGAASNRIFVVDVKPEGAADKDGRIKQADEILEVNEVTIRGLTHYEASSILKNTPPLVQMVLGRYCLTIIVCSSPFPHPPKCC